MTESAIAHLLKQTTGIDVATVGLPALTQAIRFRMAAAGVSELAAYWQRLSSEREELRKLIESIVVPETWFFRDAGAYEALVKIVWKEWAPAHSAGVLRLLSAPCSTGEEPYSLAMGLLEAGWPAERCSIEALEISTAALALAQRAIYSRNSFRSADLAFRDRYFQSVREGYSLAPEIRERVRFRQANLLGEEDPLSTGRYDIIFCRNLLIYFDAAAQARLLARLERALTPDGVLFVGAAETFLTQTHGFQAAGYQGSFACRKAGWNTPVKPPAPPPLACLSNLAPKKRPLPHRLLPTLPPSLPAPPPAAEELAAARHLADAGQLAEAHQACEGFLLRHRTSAPGYFLLGCVQESLGEKERAAECFRKVLYLEPDHAEALLHLALQAGQAGDRATAERLQRRAQRSQEGGRA